MSVHYFTLCLSALILFWKTSRRGKCWRPLHSPGASADRMGTRSQQYAPLLRTLPVRGVFGDIITQTFNPPNYVPVSKKHIENIQIQIKTDQNVPVNFSYGKTILRLHFRPIQRHINRE